ncbi:MULTISPECIES: MFS transporter [unclassified Streptomyces]|uniref:MFS transporter n=1 Tax=unclassified Streptomyces TaxID=2593676 RepID=UPI000DB95F1E|nr:MFS transporter [Streptomyces sp. PsTaAH-137]MYT73703.1 MFS transporter [Streptomyces sp. SID8367]RAJ85244.1 putative MFS family arabinose efflux permease [Streptomyces sp. PsTaAH-137]
MSGDIAETVTTAPAPTGGGFRARLTAPLLLGSVLNPLNTTMISTGLVAIGHHFGVGAADTAWLISVLYLASAVAQPVLGKLADALGPRRVFLVGLVVVCASGLVGMFASAFGWLVVSRLLLGIGTSAAYPAAMAVLRDEGRRVGRRPPRPVMARLSFAALGSAAVGPTLGGLLVTVVGWRGIFAVNVPVSVIAFCCAVLWIPADPPRGTSGEPAPRLALDPLGIGLFSTALTVLVFFLLDLSHPLWWLLAPFAVLTAALLWWQLRCRTPFIDVRMLAGNGPLARTYLRHGLSYLLIYCVMYGFTQWLEEGRGYSSGHTGLLMLPMSLAALSCSLIGARTKGIRAPLIVASALLTGGAALLAFVSGSTPLAVLLLAGACFGIPQGLIGTSNQAAVQEYAPAADIGAAAGLQRTAQYIGAITASSLIALAYGQRADDAGLHLMATVSAVLGVLLVALTVTDRALRRQR